MNWGMRVLQTLALPLGYGTTYKIVRLPSRGVTRQFGAKRRITIGRIPKREVNPRGLTSLFGAGNEARTRYLHLGKVALYQMSYARKMVPPVGVEPTTRGFSVRCSTN